MTGCTGGAMSIDIVGGDATGAIDFSIGGGL
jgi:hypothetical protein